MPTLWQPWFCRLWEFHLTGCCLVSLQGKFRISLARTTFITPSFFVYVVHLAGVFFDWNGTQMEHISLTGKIKEDCLTQDLVFMSLYIIISLYDFSLIMYYYIIMCLYIFIHHYMNNHFSVIIYQILTYKLMSISLCCVWFCLLSSCCHPNLCAVVMISADIMPYNTV